MRWPSQLWKEFCYQTCARNGKSAVFKSQSLYLYVIESWWCSDGSYSFQFLFVFPFVCHFGLFFAFAFNWLTTSICLPSIRNRNELARVKFPSGWFICILELSLIFIFWRRKILAFQYLAKKINKIEIGLCFVVCIYSVHEKYLIKKDNLCHSRLPERKIVKGGCDQAILTTEKHCEINS